MRDKNISVRIDARRKKRILWCQGFFFFFWGNKEAYKIDSENKVCVNTWVLLLLFFFISVGCPGQLARTTTIPHGPQNTLQAQWAGKTPRGWQDTQRGSNLGRQQETSPREYFLIFFLMLISIEINVKN
jgi:hypothetical protein